MNDFERWETELDDHAHDWCCYDTYHLICQTCRETIHVETWRAERIRAAATGDTK